MHRSGREDAVGTSDVKQVLGASFIGTAIEWYDFFIHGTAATLVFGQLFFSPDFSYQLASIIGGGAGPLISIYLVGATGGAFWLVIVWMVALCLITLVCVLIAAETYEGGEFSSERSGEGQVIAGQG